MKKLFAVYQCNRCNEIEMVEYPSPLDEGQIKTARQTFYENIIHDCNPDEQGIAPIVQFLEEDYEPKRV